MESINKFFHSDFGEIIKVFGILATVVITVISLIVNIRSFKKGAYIKEITTLRAKYIDNLRQLIADFASIALECNRATVLEDYLSSEQKGQLLRDLNLKYGHTLLFLDNDNIIDKKLIYYLSAIQLAATSKGDDGIKITGTIRNMFLYTQQVLLYEWRNLQYEAKHGPMTENEKEKRSKAFMHDCGHL